MNLIKISILYGAMLLLGLISCREQNLNPPINEVPRQVELNKPLILKDEKSYKMHAVAEFEAKTKLLGIEKYYIGKETEFSSYDFLVGWKKMSDENFLSKVSFSQKRRSYSWSSSDSEINSNKTEIKNQTDNISVIPSNKQIEKDLSLAKIGDNIFLKGFLVNIKKENGWKWETYLDRSENEENSSKILWVTEVVIF